MSQNYLNCNLHDYLEMACLYRFEVELILKDETKILGTPVTTKTINKIEYLELNSSGTLLAIPVLNLASMHACKDNPHFDLVKFT